MEVGTEPEGGVVDVGPDAAEEVGLVAGSLGGTEARLLFGEADECKTEPEVGELVVSSHPPISESLCKKKKKKKLTWTAAARRAARCPRMPVASSYGSSSESQAISGRPLHFVLCFNAGRELDIAI